MVYWISWNSSLTLVIGSLFWSKLIDSLGLEVPFPKWEIYGAQVSLDVDKVPSPNENYCGAAHSFWDLLFLLFIVL